MALLELFELWWEQLESLVDSSKDHKRYDSTVEHFPFGILVDVVVHFDSDSDFEPLSTDDGIVLSGALPVLGGRRKRS